MLTYRSAVAVHAVLVADDALHFWRCCFAASDTCFCLFVFFSVPALVVISHVMRACVLKIPASRASLGVHTYTRAYTRLKQVSK